MNIDSIVGELIEIRKSISEIKITNETIKSNINKEYELIIFLEKYINNLKLRNNYMDAKLFLNPSWDILVELCYARLIRKSEYVSSIVTAGGTPPTTGLRHLARLHKMGYIERENLIHDKRRVMISISDEGFALMKDFFIRASHD